MLIKFLYIFFILLCPISNLYAKIEFPSGLYIGSVYKSIISSKNKYYQVDINANLNTLKNLKIKIPYVTYENDLLVPKYSQKLELKKNYLIQKRLQEKVFIELSWEKQKLSKKGYINASIKVYGNKKNLKFIQLKLLDEKELLKFEYQANALNEKSYLTIMLVGSIKHKNFGKKENKYVYFTIKSPKTNRIWLNNNLGAESSNINSPYFNPVKKAIHFKDHLAYGKLYKWNQNFCPKGFRLPTKKEIKEELSSHGMYDDLLKLSHGGMKEPLFDKRVFAGIIGNYWLDSIVDEFNVEAFRIFNDNIFLFCSKKINAFSIRCILDN